MWTIEELLEKVSSSGGSDLILTPGAPPQIKILGQLHAVGDTPLTARETETLSLSTLNDYQKNQLVQNRSVDLSRGFAGLNRFRFNVFRQRGALALVARLIPSRIPSFSELGLPPIVQEFAMQPHGLVLVTGPAGSGKSTTLAAMIEHINSHRSAHIICLEDPIEYLHAHKQSLIEQREIYEDAPSFAHALQAVFRQSPDVIMVGEMRDLPTISTAITAAETGHLVIGTLHTLDAAQSVDRVIDLFPADQQHQIRLQFSQVVLAVLSQILLNRVGGGRIAAFEIMLATPMIRKFIREGNTGEIPANLEMGASEGKQSLDQAMAELVRRGLVAREEALLASSHPAHLADLLDAGP
ncbi:MAG: PilT/PilU family type 4a pilus ATPase [Kiritimatiellae bacterium]|jgi:twitching motility protein PilT|nr:PilT/PilU family type 4a pilus ATPase [Kiritimatiellia bacterium]